MALDPKKRVAFVEPRVTMEQLVAETLPFGLIPQVVPEFKGITLGGAIMGAAGESSSKRFGLFHDACSSYEILLGDGSLITASRDEHQDLFHGIPGSYGCFGTLTMAEIALVPAKKGIRLKYHHCRPQEALQALHSIESDFLDGIVFDRDRAVVIEGHFSDEPCQRLGSSWYAFDLKESLSLPDYLFRYDQGAFWMGAYLLNPPILVRMLLEGVFKIKKPSSLSLHHTLKVPARLWQRCLRPCLGSKTLWKIHHSVQKWVEERFVVQDFCLPAQSAGTFLEQAMETAAIYPLWLCPIKGTGEAQPFAPHINHERFINVGIYGIPAKNDVEAVMRQLEMTTTQLKGRKVLYSKSYYSEDEFWGIYSKPHYQQLREKYHANGRFKELTTKVLN